MGEGVERSTRTIEESVVTDLARATSRRGRLELDTPLAAQHPLSEPAHRDEPLFAVRTVIGDALRPGGGA